MPPLGQLGRRLWMLAHRGRLDRDLADEVRLHQELLTARGRAAGASLTDAERMARRHLGSPLRIREDTRDALGWRWLDDLGRDVRYALAGLARRKGFAAAVIATLTLGIGANTAIFSIVSGVVLAPLPFRDPDRLVQMYGTPAIRGEAVDHLDLLRARSTSFESLAGFAVSARYLPGPSGTEQVMVVTAERELFPLLGVTALAGRSFGPGDATTTAVIGERFWRMRLGGTADVIGSSLGTDDNPFTIVGVMPDRFQFPYSAASVIQGVAPQARTDVWIPLDPPADPALRARGRANQVVGRLKPGVTRAAAEGELAVITARIDADAPDRNGARGVRLERLAEAVVAPAVRRSLFFLFGAVALVLALTCANVASLLLVRMTLRTREMAARAALGAGHARLARQVITESVVLAAAGGAAGLLLAVYAERQLVAMAGARLPRAHEIGLDWRVFAFLFAACAIVGVVSSVAPIVVTLRADARTALASGGHSTTGPSIARVRDALVVVEVALALVLAVGATLLVRELVRLKNTDPGLVASNVMTFHLGNTRRRPPDLEARQLYEIADRVGRLPGVRAAGFTQLLPLQNWGWAANAVDFAPRARGPLGAAPFSFELRYVTPGYFEALSITRRRGRTFADADVRESPRVIVINEALARLAFGDEDPVGQVTNRGTIVGVIGNVRNVNLDRETLPELYYPIAQNWSQLAELGMTLVARTDGPSGPLVEPIRATIRDVTPDQAIFNVKSMTTIVAESLGEFLLFLVLIVAFALLAVALALTGTYGVVSHAASSRMREFAVRAALGADRPRIMRLVLGQGLGLVAVGLGVGMLAVAASGPLLQGLPVSVRPPDLAAILAVAAVVGAVALLAILWPARRAASADPMVVLRTE